MKRIILYFCFLAIYGCAGYEPLFSTKDLSYYVIDVENVSQNNLTDKISKRLKIYQSKDDITKKGYKLKISSKMNNIISSKDGKGNVSSYKMIINVNVKVFNEVSDLPISTLNFDKSFDYNNQENKSNLSRYKKDILENIINKISQEIIIKLQSI
mgnify:CR=1 FL=1|tara:strand:- start:3699 stop:4163 length:465 start_codon:yes stop_codon:yes gene_type:complete